MARLVACKSIFGVHLKKKSFVLRIW